MPNLAVTDLTGVTVLDVTPRGKPSSSGSTTGGACTPTSGWRAPGGPTRAAVVGAVVQTTRSAPCWARRPRTRWATDCRWSSCCRRPTRTRWWVTWARICSARTGIEDEALRRIRAQPDLSIGEALLDQRNLAGLGTFYRAELLFLQGLHPRTPVSQVSTLPRVVQRGYLLLNANKVRAEQSTTGDLRQGRRTYVFERPGQPCRRCGTSIRTEESARPVRSGEATGARAASPIGEPTSRGLAGGAPEQVPADTSRCD